MGYNVYNVVVKKFLPIILVAVVGAGGGYIGGRYVYRLEWDNFRPGVVFNESIPKEIASKDVDFSKFWTVWGKVSDSFVDKTVLDPNKMVDGAIAGMVSSLGDPYTMYLSKEQNRAEKDSLEGTFEGVGIQLGYKDKKLVVVAPLEGTPAKRAGVRPGDVIARIRDKAKKVDRYTSGITLPEAVGLIRGEKGTVVELTLEREAETAPIEVSLNRETIQIKSVEVEMVGGAAWLKLSRFGDKTQQEWDSAVNGIIASCQLPVGGKCRGIVLDLRNNPGGYLEGAVYLTSEFLPKGKVVVVQQFGDGSRRESRVTRDGRMVKTPLVVVVNEGSASAAEIMAGAVRDQKRAKIVGVKTFGKGSVQQPEDFADGSGLHTTVAKWLTPAGVWIDKNGITPDVDVKLDPQKEILGPADDDQLQKALQLL